MAEIAYAVYVSHLADLGVVSRDVKVSCSDAFDVKMIARECLKDLDHAPNHIFQDQLQMLHPQMRRHLQELGKQPVGQAQGDDEALELALQAAEAVFMEAELAGKLHRRGRQSFCHKHGKLCGLWDSVEARDHNGISMVVAGVMLNCALAARCYSLISSRTFSDSALPFQTAESLKRCLNQASTLQHCTVVAQCSLSHQS